VDFQDELMITVLIMATEFFIVNRLCFWCSFLCPKICFVHKNNMDFFLSPGSCGQPPAYPGGGQPACPGLAARRLDGP